MCTDRRSIPASVENLLGAALMFGFCSFGLAGWMMNIWTIWQDPGFTGATTLRIAGIPIWPLGALLGWF